MVDNKLIGEALTALQNLPATKATIDITIPDLHPINRKNSLEEVIDADLSIVNAGISNLIECWSHANSIGAIVKLTHATFSLLEKRRNFLLIPYGAPSKDSKGGIVYPLD